MKNVLKIAVIGVGYIGQLHASCIAQAENMELVAVVEPNEELGKQVAEQYGVQYIKTVAELKDHPEIEAVNICVPEEYHLVTAVACAEMGKHIAIEKPLAKTVEECIAIDEACKKNNVKLLVEHTIHYVPEYRLMKNAYDDGQIGNVSQITITRHLFREDMDRFKGRVSILFYVGVHDLEAVQWITGHKIVRVAALRVDSMKVFGEEGFSILFEMDNGACGTMNVGWQLPNNYPGMDRIVIVGDKGYIDYDQMNNPLKVNEGQVITAFWPRDGKIVGPYIDENIQFANAVLNGEELWMDTEDAIYIIKVMEAVQRAAESGKFETV